MSKEVVLQMPHKEGGSTVLVCRPKDDEVYAAQCKQIDPDDKIGMLAHSVGAPLRNTQDVECEVCGVLCVMGPQLRARRAELVDTVVMCIKDAVINARTEARLGNKPEHVAYLEPKDEP